jgi:rubredoxin
MSRSNEPQLTEEERDMADGSAWDDLPSDLEGPGVAIRRKDFGG